jgi:TPR repeat protein
MRSRKAVLLAIALAIVAIGAFLVHRWMSEARAVDDGIVAWKNGDDERAIRMLEPYADGGNKLAQRTVGMAYAYGQGVTRDRARAHVLLRKALGSDAHSTYLWIAKSFENGGDGVVADPGEAREWYRIAADEGSVEAQERLKREESTNPLPGA